MDPARDEDPRVGSDSRLNDVLQTSGRLRALCPPFSRLSRLVPLESGPAIVANEKVGDASVRYGSDQATQKQGSLRDQL